jgi:hypothetical protein
MRLVVLSILAVLLTIQGANTSRLDDVCTEVGFNCGCAGQQACGTVSPPLEQVDSLNFTDVDYSQTMTIIPNCNRTLTSYKVQGKWYANTPTLSQDFPDPAGEPKYFCSSLMHPRVHCEQSCLESEMPVCWGDEYYCRNKTCVPEPVSSCQCVTVSVSSRPMLWWSGSLIAPDAISETCMGSKVVFQPSHSKRSFFAQGHSHAGRKLLSSSIVNTAGVNSSVDCALAFPVGPDYHYNASVSCTKHTSVRLQINTWTAAADLDNGDVWLVEIPDEVLVGYSVATLTFYDVQSGKFLNMFQTAPLRPSCFETRSLLDWTTVVNFRCQSTWKQSLSIALAILVTAAGMLCFVLTLSCFRGLWKTVMCCWYLFRCSCCSSCGSRCMRLKAKAAALKMSADEARMKAFEKAVQDLPDSEVELESPPVIVDLGIAGSDSQQTPTQRDGLFLRSSSDTAEPRDTKAGASKILQHMSQQEKKLNANAEKARLLQMYRRSSALAAGNSARILFVMCMLATANALIVPGSDGCTEGRVVETSVSTCAQYPDGSMQCNVNVDATISIPYQGASVCLTYADQDQGIVLGTIIIEYLSLQHTLSLSTQYYTGSWRGHGTSNQRCYNAGGCPSTCNTMSPDDATGAGELRDWVVSASPGVSGCFSGCGCVNCGCFYCSSSCVYYRSVILPNGDVETVLAPSFHIYTPIVAINVFDATGVNVYSFQGEIRTGMQFSLPIGSSYPGTGLLIGDPQDPGTGQATPGVFTVNAPTIAGIPTQGINPYKVVASGGNYYFASASEPNAPVLGSIGEIQAQQPTFLSANQGTSAFKFASGYYQLNQGTTIAGFSFRDSALNSSGLNPTMIALPAVVNGNLWSVSDTGYIWTNESSRAELQMTLTSATPFNFGRMVTSVCPTAEFVSSHGCYSCAQGASMRVVAFSTCQAGPVLVYATDELGNDEPRLVVTTASVMLTKVQTEYLINFQTSVEGPFSGWLTFDSAGNKFTMPFTVSAVSGVVIVPNTSGNGTAKAESGGTTTRSNWYDGFVSFLVGLWSGSLFGKLGGVLLAVAAFVVVVILTPLFVRWVIQKKRSKTSSKRA